MFQAFAHLNWLALGLAALAYYVLGALWFTPLFGKLWDRAIGRAPSAERRFGLDYYIVPLASAILVSLALGVVLTILRPSSLEEATFVGVLIGFGVAFAVSVNNALSLRLNLDCAGSGCFLDGGVAGSWSGAAAFGASWTGSAGFWWAGGGAQGWCGAAKSSSDSCWGEACGWEAAFPGQSLVFDEIAGQA
ncbi:MAG: DUF1761 domain-containing protein [Tessaracoccus sp.]